MVIVRRRYETIALLSLGGCFSREDWTDTNIIEDSNSICFQVLVLAGNPGFLIVVVPVAIQVSAPASSPVFPTEVQVVSGPS